MEARTWVIQEDGSGDAPTVQAGIDSATVGDVVLVGPGTYYETIDFLGKDLVLRSELGPSVTTLDGSSQSASVITLNTQETSASIIEGFTITGGTGTPTGNATYGGGIRCLNSSPQIRNNHIVGNSARIGAGVAVGLGSDIETIPELVIERNTFEANHATGLGGALSIQHALGTVRENVFRSNLADLDGGGIWGQFIPGAITLQNNEFWHNWAGDHGGAVHIGDLATGLPSVIEENLFVGNQADGSGTGDTGSGGALLLFCMSGTVQRNTIVGNRGWGESPQSGGGIAIEDSPSDLVIRANILAFNEGGGLACRDQNTLELGTNLFWQNLPKNIGNNCPGDWLLQQLVADPLFCGPSVDDYHVAVDSPALTGEEVIGVYSEPGCGQVAAEATTWGSLKRRFMTP